ncbi:MAG: hypothetical protein ACR2RV_11490, partial [Verrucomicrobiales bacterium]
EKFERSLRTWQEIEKLFEDQQALESLLRGKGLAVEEPEGGPIDPAKDQAEFDWGLPPVPFAASRTWTNRESKKISARCVGVGDGQVDLILGKNRNSTVPLEKLSEADQHYATIWKQLREDFQPRPAHIPDLTSVSAAVWESDAQELGRDNDTRLWKYRTESFEFECDVKLEKDELQSASRQFEIVNRAIPALGLVPKPKSPPEKFFRVRLFSERRAYREAGGPPGSAGVFFIDHKDKDKIGVSFVSMQNLGTGNDPQGSLSTLLHETTHQVMHHQLRNLPMWAVEGLADYIGSREYKRDELRFPVPANDLDSYYQRKLGRDWGGKIRWKKPSEVMGFSQRKFMGAPDPAGRPAPGPPGARAIPVLPRQPMPNHNVTSNYVCSMLLVNFLLHHDGPEGAERFATYLENFAAGMIDAQLYLDAYNEAVDTHNEAIQECSKVAQAFNAAMLSYDQKLHQYGHDLAAFELGAGDRSNPPIQPGLPNPAKFEIVKPVPPRILKTPRLQQDISPSNIEKRARAILLNGRSQDEFDTLVKETYLGLGLDLT